MAEIHFRETEGRGSPDLRNIGYEDDGVSVKRYDNVRALVEALAQRGLKLADNTGVFFAGAEVIRTDDGCDCQVFDIVDTSHELISRAMLVTPANKF